MNLCAPLIASIATSLIQGVSMFQTIYSGYIKYGPKRLSVHPEHSEQVFQIGSVKLTYTETIEVMADLQKFIDKVATPQGANRC